MNEQLTMDRAGLNHPLYRELARDVTGRAERVIIGLNWTLVVGPNGAGLSHTPARGTGGCFSLPDSGGYTGQGLASLAAMIESENVFETAIAIAATNAFHNRYDLTGATDNGLDLIPDGGSGTVVIGRFPGLDRRIPEARVIEREPGPNDYPESDQEILLPECRQLIITASTMLDGALPRLLALAPQAYTILLGPGTPMATTLFDHGIDVLSGLVVDDIDALSRAVTEGGAVRAMKRHSHNLSLFRPDS